MEKDLDSFRDQWLRELSGNGQGRDTSAGGGVSDPLAEAVELFLKAGRSEEKGKMVKAVRLYRKAFKLCPELEEVQMQRELRLEERVVELSRAKEEEKSTTSVLSRSMASMTLQSDNLSTVSVPSWAAEFSSSKCIASSQIPEGKAHISVLPNELLVHVLHFCTDEADVLEAAGGVCRLWFAASRETSLWRAACERRWPSEIEGLECHVKEELRGDWRRCYLEKPRPRHDGLYVSTNKYVRQGQQEGFFYDPIHEVHYWRLLRFYPTGEALSLCTVEKSSAKRMHIQVALQQKEWARRNRGRCIVAVNGPHQTEKTELGSFEMVGDGFRAKLSISTHACSAKHLSSFVGTVYSSRSGWQDRIKIESYSRTNIETESVSTFEPEFISVYKFVKLPPEYLHYQQQEQS